VQIDELDAQAAVVAGRWAGRRAGRGGERQSVAIARAVYFGAKVLILDEPTSALGVKQAAVVLRYIAQTRDQGIGVIFITRNVHHADPIADRFTILKSGHSLGTFEKFHEDENRGRETT
jgi:simple sugar transport system ATP-binding protein